MKKSLIFILSIIFSIALCSHVNAEVTGDCVNCHTMHSSQGGGPVAYEFSGGSFSSTTNPQNTLLISDCVGCHTAIDSSTWKDTITGAPIVYNTSAPDYGATTGDGKYAGLAAGNFYWVGQDQANGHNIFVADTALTDAPGRVSSGCTSDCHNSLTYSGILCTYRGWLGSCGNCHMVTGDSTYPSNTRWHHRDDSGPVVDSPEEGWYRFLGGHQSGDGRGVAGIEDPDWEHTPTSTSHNEYLGKVDSAKSTSGGFYRVGANAISGFCMGCHNAFHIQDTTGSGASPWIRHPSDAVIPITGEYAGYTTYNPLAPVARPSLTGWTGPSSSVNESGASAKDLVMCLTCHRAHASPYYKMLRWDYKSTTLATSLSGCRVCHSMK